MGLLAVEIDILTIIGLIIILAYLGSKVIQCIGIPQEEKDRAKANGRGGLS